MENLMRTLTIKSKWEKIWEDLFEEDPCAQEPKGNMEFYDVKVSEFARVKSILQYLVTIGTGRVPGLIGKDETVARNCRNSANDYLCIPELHSIDNAIEEFTKMIAHSPPDSRELVMGYANRSDVLCKVFMMSDCLLDINRALEIGFPEGLKGQLYYRITKCYEGQNVGDVKMQEALAEMRHWMENMTATDREDLENLIEEEKRTRINTYSDDSRFFKWNNDKIPPIMVGHNDTVEGLSWTVELKYDAKYGRHLVAATDIHPGQVLAARKPYVRIPHWLMRYKICWNCGRQTWSGVPCNDCADIIFCSETCRDKANLEYHDIECPLVKVMSNLKLSDKLFMAVRLFIKGYKEVGNSVKGLKNLVKEIDAQKDPLMRGFINNFLYATTFSTIYSLTKNDGDDKYSCHSILVAYLFATRTQIFGDEMNLSLDLLKFNSDFIFVSMLIEKLTRLSTCNAFEDMLRDRYDKLIRTSHSLVPPHSFFNHQCYPSACASYYGEYKIVESLTHIKKGQQIFLTYGENAHHFKPVAARRQDLYKQFEFHCDCRACSCAWPVCFNRTFPPNFDPEGRVTSTGTDVIGQLLKFERICLAKTEDHYFEKILLQPDITMYVLQLRETIETLSREVDSGNWYLISAQLYMKKFIGLLENRFIVVDHYYQVAREIRDFNDMTDNNVLS